jgi:hypothetical protein
MRSVLTGEPNMIYRHIAVSLTNESQKDPSRRNRAADTGGAGIAHM